jgi:hypothetical protein
LVDHYSPDQQLTYGHTDALPGHGEFALAALTEAPLAEGVWEAFASAGELGGWGGRVWSAGIRLVDSPVFDSTTESEQGVDAGMVGFFVNTPRLCYDETWSRDGGRSCTGMTRLLSRGTGLAWVTDSGVGDGCYPVTTHWRDGRIVAVTAVYLNDEDENDEDEFDEDEFDED